LRQLVLKAQPHPFKIYRNLTIELYFSDIGSVANPAFDPGGVKGAIDPAIGADCFPNQGFNLGTGADIAFYCVHIPSGRPNHCRGLVCRNNVGYYQSGTLAGKSERRGASDPGSRSGY
jgi:hypothetical protein